MANLPNSPWVVVRIRNRYSIQYRQKFTSAPPLVSLSIVLDSSYAAIDCKSKCCFCDVMNVLSPGEGFRLLQLLLKFDQSADCEFLPLVLSYKDRRICSACGSPTLRYLDSNKARMAPREQHLHRCAVATRSPTRVPWQINYPLTIR